jgi:cytochrome b561
MSFSNSKHGYGWPAITMHWVSAVAIFFLFALGLWMVTLDYNSSFYHDAPYVHKSVGILLIILTVFRFIGNFFNPRQEGVDGILFDFLALAVHMTLYVLVFALGVTGYLISTAESAPIEVFGLFNVPALLEPFDNQADLAGLLHEWLAYSLMGLVAIHVLGVLKHQFIDKDDTLMKMFREKE